MKTLLLCIALLTTVALGAQDPPAQGGDSARNQDPWTAATFADFRLRSIGPAIMSGRISHIAVHPEHKQTWYIGVASGGVWKTTNAGITFTPVFQNEGAYSIGAVVIDRKTPDHDLGRHRRSQQPAQRRIRRRRVSQRRRRPHVAECRPEDVRADRPHRHRPARFEGGLRRRLRSALERAAATVDSTRRRTAERTGPRCSTSARTPASATSPSIRSIPT